MQCISPINIDVRGTEIGARTKKAFVLVPCGRCPACLTRRQNEWAFRLAEEHKNSVKTYFLTLTYDDAHLEYTLNGVPTLNKKTASLFIRYLRRKLPKSSLRYFLCGEYGDAFDRPHYHCILFFNYDIQDDYLDYLISKIWINGFYSLVPYNNIAQAKYVAKYCNKKIGYDYEDKQSPFSLKSTNPGIGASFKTQENQDRIRVFKNFVFHDEQGTPYPIPRYYKDYFFSKSEQIDNFIKCEDDSSKVIDIIKHKEHFNNDKKSSYNSVFNKRAKEILSIRERSRKEALKNSLRHCSENYHFVDDYEMKLKKQQLKRKELEQLQNYINETDIINNFENEK